VSAPPDGGDGQAPSNNCGAESCKGHGRCVITGDESECVCDQGYIAQETDGVTDCVVDTTCIRLKPLVKPTCRIQTRGAPAVALFFAVDYCAGTAVLPGDLGSPDEAFVVKQDGENLAGQAEGSFRVIDREVESYVTFAIDVSESLTQDTALLTQVITELRETLAQLERPVGEPPVSVSLLVFGRRVREYLPFTSDLTRVDDALAAIVTDPSTVSELADGQGGTSLHEAVGKGIRSVERIQALRDAA